MKQLLLILGMWSVSALFFYLSFENLNEVEDSYDLEAFTVAYEDFPTLSWSIQNIQALKQVEVLRSENGKDWDVVEKINSKLRTKSNFTYQDKSDFNRSAAHLYYQLRFVDSEDNIQLSEVILTQPIVPHTAKVVHAALYKP